MVCMGGWTVAVAVLSIIMYATPGGMTKEEQERSCLVWGHDQESGPQFYGEALIIALISCIFSLHLDVGFSLNPKACLVAILS